MILQLSLRYFLLNQKRTVKGSQIVAIGFIAVFATTVLIGGFATEISIVTSKLNKTDVTYSIIPDTTDQFNNEQIKQLENLGSEERGIAYLNFERIEFGYFSSSDYLDIEMPIHFTNLTKIAEQILPTGFEFDDNRTTLFATLDFKNSLNLGIGNIYHIKSSNFSISAALTEFINPDQPIINSGLYLDLESTKQKYIDRNRAIIQFSQNTNIPRLLGKIRDIEDISINLIRGENEFLRLSADNISRTLYVLQIAISILVFLSIFNLMNIIILESRYDIRVLLSIGYSKNSVWLLYVLIGGLIGLIGALFTLIVSVVIISAILSLLSAIGFPFILVSIGINQVISLFLNILLITIASSLIPSYIGVNSTR